MKYTPTADINNSSNHRYVYNNNCQCMNRQNQAIETGVTTTTLPTLNLTDAAVDEELLENLTTPLQEKREMTTLFGMTLKKTSTLRMVSYEIQYYYQEDSLKLAETGIDLDYILISGSLGTFCGIGIVWFLKKKESY